MADWIDPTVLSQYDLFVGEAKDRDIDACTLFLNVPTNAPNGAIRYNRSTNSFEQYNSALAVWNQLVLAIVGGGTGGGTIAIARNNLGLGTMAIQNANLVAISGGVIVGLTQLDLSTSLTFSADDAFDIATFAKQARKGYFKDALVLPVGVDKFATS